jgi:diguanylate cyclase (GGDEF)-like protein
MPWLPAGVLVALAGLIAALEGSWQWLAVASFAVVAAGTIAAQSVELVTHERLLLRLTRLNQLTARQARLDPLTRLPNRAALDTRLAEEVERSIRYRHPASVLFVDVDHFKAINDLQGHAAGDRALRAISNTIRSTIRTPDFVARFGGEEFVIIAPGTWSVDAAVLGKRIQTAVGHAVHHADGSEVTVSVGIAGVPEHAATPDDVLRTADEALYLAKRAGRNRVEIAVAPGDQDLLDNS